MRSTHAPSVDIQHYAAYPEIPFRDMFQENLNHFREPTPIPSGSTTTNRVESAFALSLLICSIGWAFAPAAWNARTTGRDFAADIPSGRSMRQERSCHSTHSDRSCNPAGRGLPASTTPSGSQVSMVSVAAIETFVSGLGDRPDSISFRP